MEENDHDYILCEVKRIKKDCEIYNIEPKEWIRRYAEKYRKEWIASHTNNDKEA